MEGFEAYGLIAIVAAFISKGLLVRPHKVAVPGKEEAITMYIHSLIDVYRNKVIKSRLRCWGPCLVGFGR